MADLIKQVGQLFMVGFHSHEANEEITGLIRDYGVGSIVLFVRNVWDASQLRKLTADLQRIAKDAGHERPLFIAIDQEGGIVTRIKPPVLAQMPGAMTLGASTWPDAAREVSAAIADALQCLGINMNLAPIGDVNSEPKNPVIGVRSPGDDPHKVGEVSSAIAKAYRDYGVCPVIKHFPSHGDTAVDSHYGLPVITKSVADFAACELVLFQRSIANGIEAVMTAHISIPALDTEGLPASLSHKATDLLRDQMQFDGLLMSDCLEMDGVRATFGTVKAAELAFAAGTDCIMICHTHDIQKQAMQNIAEQLRNGQLSRNRLDEALRRTAALKDKYLIWDIDDSALDLSALNSQHEEIARKTYESAVTLFRDDRGVLPLKKASKIVFLQPGAKIVAGGAVDSGEMRTWTPFIPLSFSDVLGVRAAVESIRYDEDYQLTAEHLGHFQSADAVVLVTRNAAQSQYQHKLGMTLSSRVDKLIVVASCDPYDFLSNPEIGAYLTTYEPTVEAFQAAVKIMFGELEAFGKLPVRITQQ